MLPRPAMPEAPKDFVAAYLARAALQATVTAVVITDRTGRIEFVNQAFTNVTGYPADEVLGRTPQMLRSGTHDRTFYRNLWDTILAGQVWQGQIVNRRKDGTHYTEDMTITPVRDLSGAVTHFVAIKTDITERLRAEAERQRQRDLAFQREKLAHMGQMLAGVAHELNNPLAVVLGQAELLESKASDAATARRAATIKAAAERAARTIKTFLSIARPQPQKAEVVSFNTVVRDTVEIFAYQLRAEDIELVLDLAEDLPFLVGDPHLLEQVILNLMTNAVHAMRLVTRPRRLTLVTATDRPAKTGIIFTMHDTGPGIPPAVLGRLFEPFVTTQPVGEGTGLGLSVCRRLVEAHDGTLQLASTGDEGTVFRIDLPGTAAGGAEPSTPVEERWGDATGLQALVVDDEAEIVDLVSELLTGYGYVVDSAPHGAAALSLVDGKPYDLIVCDLKMPTMDGQGFFEAIEHTHPELAERILFLTGDTVGSATDAFLARVRDRCLEKPFSGGDLGRAVARITRPPRA